MAKTFPGHVRIALPRSLETFALRIPEAPRPQPRTPEAVLSAVDASSRRRMIQRAIERRRGGNASLIGLTASSFHLVPPRGPAPMDSRPTGSGRANYPLIVTPRAPRGRFLAARAAKKAAPAARARSPAHAPRGRYTWLGRGAGGGRPPLSVLWRGPRSA